MSDVLVIREACVQLRRLPQPQWSQPPRAPLGARAPHLPVTTHGKTVKAIALDVARSMMVIDASVRGVPEFPIGTNPLALPDVIEALAKSLVTSTDPRSIASLADAAQRLRTLYG